MLPAMAVSNLVLGADSAPKFAPVGAELIRPRDGLGNVIEKLQAGKPVKIAYLGGSITAAAGWRVQTRQWFSDEFPEAQVEEIHAAIGGTGSDLGVFRLQWDALRHRPDLLFVEFAVNDGGAPPERIFRAMEGIVEGSWRPPVVGVESGGKLRRGTDLAIPC
jgi:lysophospholipase L1-like esterase